MKISLSLSLSLLCFSVSLAESLPLQEEQTKSCCKPKVGPQGPQGDRGPRGFDVTSIDYLCAFSTTLPGTPPGTAQYIPLENIAAVNSWQSPDGGTTWTVPVTGLYTISYTLLIAPSVDVGYSVIRLDGTFIYSSILSFRPRSDMAISTTFTKSLTAGQALGLYTNFNLPSNLSNNSILASLTINRIT